MSVIECSSLSRKYLRHQAVSGVDLALGRGTIGVLGPNGAGKSTLLAMLATALAPTSGSLSIFGLDPGQPTERLAIRRRLGYLPQHGTLYPRFTVRRILEYVAVLKEITEPEVRHRAIDDALAAVDLADHAHRRIGSLSGGLRHRTSLAAALLGDPEMLILDEPASGLDPSQHHALRGIVSRTAARGTVVMVSHHPGDVAEWCDDVIVMAEGTIRFRGAPAELASLAAPALRAAGSPAEALEAGYLAVLASPRLTSTGGIP